MISPVAAPYDNTGDQSQVGEPDGHGLFGLLDEDAEDSCAICGWRGPHLGLHAYKGHGMSARQYKLEHGLRRSKGLVATAVLEKLVEHGTAQMPSRTGLIAARDPKRATAVRLAGGMPNSPAGAVASSSGLQTPHRRHLRGVRRGVLPVPLGAPAEVLHTVLRQPAQPAASPTVWPCPLTRVDQAGQAMSGSG